MSLQETQLSSTATPYGIEAILFFKGWVFYLWSKEGATQPSSPFLRFYLFIFKISYQAEFGRDLMVQLSNGCNSSKVSPGRGDGVPGPNQAIVTDHCLGDRRAEPAEPSTSPRPQATTRFSGLWVIAEPVTDTNQYSPPNED